MTEERKTSLGEFLKKERERRGITIEQTSSATKIGLKVLKQLEEDRYSELPALPFVRGFVRNYAKFLGIDGEKLLLEYADFLEEHSRQRPKRDVGHSGYAFERPEGEQSRRILWGVMAATLIFGGAVVFVFKPSLKHRRHGHVDKLRASPKPTATPVANADATTASPTPTTSPSVVAEASPAPATSPSPSPTAVAAKAPPSPSPSPQKPFVPPKVPIVLLPPEARPRPTPSPSPSPVVAVSRPSPVPSPAPAPAASPSPAVAAVLDPADDLKKDPLQSGTNYPPKEVKYKVIVRTKADVWVRYQCDDKKMMKFALKAGKILVLRGKRIIHFQASNPDSITLQPSGGAEKPLSSIPEAFEHGGSTTVVYPPQARENIAESFKVGAPLPRTEGPASAAAD